MWAFCTLLGKILLYPLFWFALYFSCIPQSICNGLGLGLGTIFWIHVRYTTLVVKAFCVLLPQFQLGLTVLCYNQSYHSIEIPLIVLGWFPISLTSSLLILPVLLIFTTGALVKRGFLWLIAWWRYLKCPNVPLCRVSPMSMCWD